MSLEEITTGDARMSKTFSDQLTSVTEKSCAHECHLPSTLVPQYSDQQNVVNY